MIIPLNVSKHIFSTFGLIPRDDQGEYEESTASLSG